MSASVSIVQRGKQSFRVRTRWRDPQTGEQQEINETVRGTRAVAEARKRQIIEQFASGQVTRLSNDSVGKFLDDWLTYRIALGEVRETTGQTYRSMLKNFVDAHGHVPLTTVKPELLKDWMRSMIVSKGIAATRYVAVILKKAFSSAVREGVMLSNPFDRLELPKAKAERKKTTLDAKQIKDVWQRSKEADDEIGFLLRLALETGLRRGELAALRWGDIAIDGLVKVNQTAVECYRTVKVWEPKTKASVRRVRVTDAMRDEINARRGDDDRYLFGGERVPQRPERLSDALASKLRALGVKGFTAHDLRHAHATHLLRNKLSPAAVSRRLGHSKTSITLDTYSHALVDDDAAILETMEGVLR